MSAWPNSRICQTNVSSLLIALSELISTNGYYVSFFTAELFVVLLDIYYKHVHIMQQNFVVTVMKGTPLLFF